MEYSNIVMYRNFDQDTSEKLGLDCFDNMYYIKYKYKVIKGNLNNYYVLQIAPFIVLSLNMNFRLKGMPLLFKDKKSAVEFNKKHFAIVSESPEINTVSTLNKDYKEGVILKPIYDTMTCKYLNNYKQECIVNINNEYFKFTRRFDVFECCGLIHKYFDKPLVLTNVFKDNKYFDESYLVFNDYKDAEEFLSIIKRMNPNEFRNYLPSKYATGKASISKEIYVTLVEKITIDKNNVTKL